MRSNPFIRLLGLAITLTIHAAHCSAELPRTLTPPDNLQTVLDRIHNHAASDAWKNPGWKDASIEAWLKRMVSVIARGVDDQNLALPVSFNDVTPAINEELVPRQIARFNALPSLQNRLLLLDKDKTIFSLSHSIVLADGNLEITTGAEDSIIVCRGAMKGTSKRCVIVAGTEARLGFDGVRDPKEGSIIITRGWADVEHSNGSKIVALGGVIFGHPEKTVLINSVIAGPTGPLADFTNVRVPQLPLDELPIHPLTRRIAVLGLVNPPKLQDQISRLRLEPKGIVFTFDDQRVIAFLGHSITDGAGHQIQGLENWKLIYIGSAVAVFSDGTSEAIVPFEKK